MRKTTTETTIPSLGKCAAAGKSIFTYTNAKRVSKFERRRRHQNYHQYECDDCRHYHVGSSESIGPRSQRLNRGAK